MGNRKRGLERLLKRGGGCGGGPYLSVDGGVGGFSDDLDEVLRASGPAWRR